MTSSIVLAYKLELYKHISEERKAHGMLSMIKPRDLLPISQLIAQLRIFTPSQVQVSCRAVTMTMKVTCTISVITNTAANDTLTQRQCYSI